MHPLGDTLAEGVYWLLDGGRRIQDADEPFWRDFLHRRGALIQQIVHRVSRVDGDPVRTARMVTALKAAYGRLKRITPELCVDYLRAWGSTGSNGGGRWPSCRRAWTLAWR